MITAFKKRSVDKIINTIDNEKKRKIDIKKEEKYIEDLQKNQVKNEKKRNNEEIYKCYSLSNGIGIEKNEVEAKKICLELLKEDDLIAKGLQSFNGWDIDKDLKKSFDYFSEFLQKEKFKNKTTGIAYNMMGNFYEKGLGGVEQNYRIAINYYLRSLELGDCIAMNNLGMMFQKEIMIDEEKIEEENLENEEKIDSDLFQAIFSPNNKKNTRSKRESSNNSRKRINKKKKKKTKSPKKSFNDTDISVAPFRMDSLLEGTHFEKAFRLFDKSSEMGCCDAMFNYGYMSFIGMGVDKNLDVAFEYFRRSSDFGNKEAMYQLAYMYFYGMSVEKDEELALQYFKKSSKLGNSTSMNNLAFMYLQGKGVEKDVQKAIRLYKKSSKLDNVHAMNNLACIYLNGNSGVEKNVKKAIKLFERSSNNNNNKATHNLACIYLNGSSGVEKDVQKAIQLFEKSSSSGYREDMVSLATIYESVQVNLDKSCFYFFKLYQSETDKQEKEKFRNKIVDILSKQKTEWSKEYHSFWNSDSLSVLNDQIFVLLSVSKFRSFSSFKQTGYFVKGVMNNIIKFLCHFQQSVPDQN